MTILVTGASGNAGGAVDPGRAEGEDPVDVLQSQVADLGRSGRHHFLQRPIRGAVWSKVAGSGPLVSLARVCGSRSRSYCVTR